MSKSSGGAGGESFERAPAIAIKLFGEREANSKLREFMSREIEDK